MRLVHEMKDDAESFHRYFRMDKQHFDWLLSRIADKIVKQNTPFRVPIAPEIRLALTLW